MYLYRHFRTEKPNLQYPVANEQQICIVLIEKAFIQWVLQRPFPYILLSSHRPL